MVNIFVNTFTTIYLTNSLQKIFKKIFKKILASIFYLWYNVHAVNKKRRSKLWLKKHTKYLIQIGLA